MADLKKTLREYIIEIGMVAGLFAAVLVNIALSSLGYTNAFSVPLILLAVITVLMFAGGSIIYHSMLDNQRTDEISISLICGMVLEMFFLGVLALYYISYSSDFQPATVRMFLAGIPTIVIFSGFWIALAIEEREVRD